MMVLLVCLYIVASIGVFLIVRYNFREAKLWQKAVMIMLSPLMLAAMAVIFICMLPGHIKKNGFHNILPRRKGKAYPLDAEDFEFWPKVTVLSGDKKLSIDEFNQKFGKALSLDEVYGNGYVAALTPEEVFECKSFLTSKYGLEPNMPDSAYKNAAVALAVGLSTGVFTRFDALLSSNADLVLFDKEERNGQTEVVKYFSDWVARAHKDGVEYKTTVQWSVNQCRPEVLLKIKGYKDMRMFFYVKENLIDTVTFLPALIQSYGALWNDVDKAPLKYDSIKPYITKDSEGKLYSLICPGCGTNSFMLDRYRFSADLGPIGYGGDVSVCPDCNRVVEVATDTRYRFDNDHKPEEVAFPPVSSEDKAFVPRLKGLYTFETDDDGMDFYSNEELAKIAEEIIDNTDLERRNTQAIIWANNGDTARALETFIDLSERGCRNAMMNMFSVYWANSEDYKSATDWLLYISGSDSVSPLCLWNLAVLYFSGSALPHNTLPKDTAKAKSILNRIIEQFGGNEYEALRNNTRKFLETMDNINLYSQSGRDIHAIITNSMVKTEGIKDKGELFNRAKALRLKDGLRLGVHIASADTDDIGDESRWYVYDENGVEESLRPEHFIVEPTAMGAWQLYLVMTSPTVMPVFWHGGYILREFIFSPTDLNNIEPIQNRDLSIIHKDGDLLPAVKLSDGGKYADVYCTFWNDWKGLVREHVRITFLPDGSANYGKPDEFVFYPYDCGICF